jgi:hypothetical protein
MPWHVKRLLVVPEVEKVGTLVSGAMQVAVAQGFSGETEVSFSDGSHRTTTLPSAALGSYQVPGEYDYVQTFARDAEGRQGEYLWEAAKDLKPERAQESGVVWSEQMGQNSCSAVMRIWKVNHVQYLSQQLES